MAKENMKDIEMLSVHDVQYTWTVSDGNDHHLQGLVLDCSTVGLKLEWVLSFLVSSVCSLPAFQCILIKSYNKSDFLHFPGNGTTSFNS
jgi:hypothetical protein